MLRTLSYYRKLPYARRVRLCVEDGERYWHAWVEELPGCEVDAPTKAAAYVALNEVFEDYVKAKIEWKSIIPEPERWPRLPKRASRKKGLGTVRLLKAPAPVPAGVSNSPVEILVRTEEAIAGV